MTSQSTQSNRPSWQQKAIAAADMETRRLQEESERERIEYQNRCRTVHASMVPRIRAWCQEVGMPVPGQLESDDEIVTVESTGDGRSYNLLRIRYYWFCDGIYFLVHVNYGDSLEPHHIYFGVSDTTDNYLSATTPADLGQALRELEARCQQPQ